MAALLGTLVGKKQLIFRKLSTIITRTLSHIKVDLVFWSHLTIVTPQRGSKDMLEGSSEHSTLVETQMILRPMTLVTTC